MILNLILVSISLVCSNANAGPSATTKRALLDAAPSPSPELKTTASLRFESSVRSLRAKLDALGTAGKPAVPCVSICSNISKQTLFGDFGRYCA
eukprot:6160978-Pleurochrysis_carterae.AAC.1